MTGDNDTLGVALTTPQFDEAIDLEVERRVGDRLAAALDEALDLYVPHTIREAIDREVERRVGDRLPAALDEALALHTPPTIRVSGLHCCIGVCDRPVEWITPTMTGVTFALCDNHWMGAR